MLTIHSQDVFFRYPSLQTPENCLRLLLTWSPNLHGKTLQALCNWAQSEEGLRFSTGLVKEFSKHEMPAQLTMILLALLSFERLLPYSPGETILPIGRSYLEDLDVILSGQERTNKRAVLEEMVFSFSRVLSRVKGYETILHVKNTVLDKDPPQSGLGGLSEKYAIARLEERVCHKEALNRVLNVDENVDHMSMISPSVDSSTTLREKGSLKVNRRSRMRWLLCAVLDCIR